jgi:F-type H+-transporting ATPase subunit a
MHPIVALVQEHPAAAQEAAEKGPVNIGELIIGHVADSSLEHPLIHLPPIFGIDMSVTKHVFMLWLVALILFVFVTTAVRRYVRQARLVPAGAMGPLEIGVEFIRDGVVLPSMGHKAAKTFTPFLLTLFLFILGCNVIGLIPIFDVIGLLDHYVLHTGEGSFIRRLTHGGTTATGNYNVTAGLAVVTFFAIIVAGWKAHGFWGHWKNLASHGIALVPLELLGMFVRPFALTMRLAANMTGGHIAILALLSFVFIFTDMTGRWLAGVGVGLVFSVPVATAIYALEIIIVLVQAYVFTLLSAVFIGMAAQSHHHH